MGVQMKNKLKITVIAAAGCVLTGCTCVSTHVPGRRIDHGPNPGGIDRFFCNLDYILFPPEQGYVVAPPPPPPPAPAAVPAVVVIPEYGYDWWKGTWVPRYRNWYWYHGTWEWGGAGPRPVPPAWAPDLKRRPLPPPPKRGIHHPARYAAPPHGKPRHHPVAKPAHRARPAGKHNIGRPDKKAPKPQSKVRPTEAPAKPGERPPKR